MSAYVSIIIPAHNAAATLAETLESVQAQTVEHWEAIVIENGSTDNTWEVANEWASRDGRIRVVQSAPGVSLARNTGLKHARYPWILFLDADDWILPAHLERLTSLLGSNPELDAAHCGWLRIGPDGSVLIEEFGPSDSDLYPRFARTCAITIHSCITRRTLIESAGAFDPTLRTCEDWDLWQRLSRIGCRFGAVREALACYRTRPGSASMNAAQLVADSRKVIERGFSADSRVSSPLQKYALGLPGEDMRATLLYTVTWAAGLSIGGDIDAAPLLDLVDTGPGISLDPSGVAGCIFCCAMLPSALPTSSWAEKFETVDPLLQRFLEALESRLNQRGLARSVHASLSRMALDVATRKRPFSVGRIQAVQIEITEPIPSLILPETIERLHCIVLAENKRLGVLELPVVDGAMPADILADAIAAEFAWPVLGLYFSKAVYPCLRAAKENNGWTVHRGNEILAAGIPGNGTMSWTEAHDHIGWTVFLQEAWGAPELPADAFYAGAPRKSSTYSQNKAIGTTRKLVVELSDPWPQLSAVEPGTTAFLTVGGIAVARTTIGDGSQTTSTKTLRAALTTEAAFELCCACVREGLLGRSLNEKKSLRIRLSEQAARRRVESAMVTGTLDLNFLSGSSIIPARSSHLEPDAVVLPRRTGACGTSASRRALLPRSLFPILATDARCESPLSQLSQTKIPSRIIYSPENFWEPVETSSNERLAAKSSNGPGTRPYDRNFFEELFQESPNPWHYRTAYEQTKYEQTIALLPRPRFGKALELACAEGHFTAMLATRVDHLSATDVSSTALRRATTRCHAHANVVFAEMDLLRDAFPGRFELIVCSEVLYYTGTLESLRKVIAKIEDALEPDGYFITAHAHLVVDEPHRAGFDWDLPFGAKRIADVLGESSRLRLVSDLRTPLYRIQVYQRQNRFSCWFRQQPAKRILLSQPTELPVHVAAHALWRGGLPQRFQSGTPVVQTSRLPILMYHHVAPDGSPGRRRYRVSPETFEAQLRVLVARGFRCVSLEEWRCAMVSRRPLSGRCVALTFDDGYCDFSEHAWPLLQRYGMSASVFLPSDYVGDMSRWESADEMSRLLSWEEVRRLRDDGVDFGSHSATHPALTSLSPTDIAREALRSRIALEKHLDQPVTSFAYPFGETDRVVENLIGACGYTFGLTCDERPCELRERLTALPRLEIRGDLNLPDFEALFSKLD